MFSWSEAHWTPLWMAFQITPMDEIVPVVNFYAIGVKTERKEMFKSVLLLLQVYDGPTFVGQDFIST